MIAFVDTIGGAIHWKQETIQGKDKTPANQKKKGNIFTLQAPQR